VSNVYKTVFSEKSGIPWNLVSERIFSASSAQFQFLCLKILIHIAKMMYVPQSKQSNPQFDKFFTQSLASNIFQKIVKNKNAHEVVRAHALHFVGICSVRDGVCSTMLRNGIVTEITGSWNAVKESDENVAKLLEAINVYCSWVSKNAAVKELVIGLLPKLCQQSLARSTTDIMFLTALSLRHILPQQTINFSFVESLMETLFATSESKIVQALAGCLEIILFQSKIKFPDNLKDKESARLHLLQKFVGYFNSNKLALSHSFDLVRRLFEDEDAEGEKMNDVEFAAKSLSVMTKVCSILVDKSSLVMPHDTRARRLLTYLCLKRPYALIDIIPDMIYSLSTYFAHAIQSNAVLRQVYQYVRMDLNVSMASDIYDSIDGLLSYLIEKEDGDLVERLNTGFITHIETFVPAVQANENTLRALQQLLFKIRELYTMRLSRNSEIALQKLDIVMATYFEPKTPVMSFHNAPSSFSGGFTFTAPPLRLMLVYKNDISIEQTSSPTLTFEQLIDGIRQKYGKNLIPKYNYRGTLIAIENQVSLDRALSNSNREVLRLELFDSHHSNDSLVPQSLQNDGYITYLGKRYKIDIAVLKELRNGWLAVTPNNYMTRDLFMVSLGSGQGTHDPAFAELLFSGMDAAKTGGINFESWVQAVAMLKG
jgi:hypothetical protein